MQEFSSACKFAATEVLGPKKRKPNNDADCIQVIQERNAMVSNTKGRKKLCARRSMKYTKKGGKHEPDKEDNEMRKVSYESLNGRDNLLLRNRANVVVVFLDFLCYTETAEELVTPLDAISMSSAYQRMFLLDARTSVAIKSVS